VDIEKAQHWTSRGQFFAAAAEAMRRVLIDNAQGELRQRVQVLLRRCAEAVGPLDRPAVRITAPPLAFAEALGIVIGSYKLLEQIGEGGFGVVYMAEQIAPVCRKVALKLLKPGMDTRHVVAGFEAERQALALTDHPHIAGVFDGGATPAGRTYFVMELVKGVPITEYCDQNQLAPRQRLELFLQVRQAVQHAHQKGIIHRELKPSNILVSRHDSSPVVKVIDFGVARALGQGHRLAAALQPFMLGGADLHQLAEAGPARPAAAVRVAAALPLPQPLGDQPAAQRLRADRPPLAGQLLGGERGAEVRVAAAVRGQHGPAEARVGLVVGGLASQPVAEGAVALGLQLPLEASDLAGAQAEQARGLGLSPLAALHRVQDLDNIALLLIHGNPVGTMHADRHSSSLA
jgi:hypothetical protein